MAGQTGSYMRHLHEHVNKLQNRAEQTRAEQQRVELTRVELNRIELQRAEQTRVASQLSEHRFVLIG